jgi:tetratricopeptide (TPR) repeat protein
MPGMAAHWKVLALAGLCGALATASAAAGGRVALVIGNAAYEQLAPLNNPIVDATRMAQILKKNGFDVLSCDGSTPGCFNLDREAMTDALESFEDMTTGADMAFVFYAGHGMQTAKGNVLAPVNMKLSCDTLDPSRAMLLDNVMESLGDAKEKVVIIDACRNDPLQSQQCAQRGGRPLSFGSFAVPESDSKFLILSSTKAGQVAQDGPPGQHSPFAESLFAVMDAEPGITFDQMFNRAIKDVIEKTTAAKFTQIPEMLTRGGAPETCLRGSDCSSDPQAASLKAEVDKLREERARGQEYEEIVTALLRNAGYDSLESIPANQRESVFRGIVDASKAIAERNDTAGERALAALKDGDQSAAERLFEEEIRNRTSNAEAELRKAADTHRHLAALSRPKDVGKASRHFSEAARLDPKDIQTWLDFAATATEAGNSSEALRAYREASALARDTGSLTQRIWAAIGQGDIVLAQGRLDRALDFYTAAKTLAEARTREEPNDVDTYRDLSVLLNKVGSVYAAQGNLSAALAAYRDGLRIVQSLSKSNPLNTMWAFDVGISNERVGDVLMAQGNVPAALKSYQARHDTVAELSAMDPGNASLKRDMSVSFNKIGNAYFAQGNFAGALQSFNAGLDIVARLVEQDPSNAGWQRDLAYSSERIGDVNVSQGDLDGALAAFQKTKEIRERLFQADPGNVSVQFDIGISNERVGDIYYAQGNYDEALRSYEARHQITTTLAASDPGNSGWQRDISVSHNKIGSVYEAQGKYEDALRHYQDGLVIMARLAAGDPGNAGWQRDVAISHNKIGDARVAMGQSGLDDYTAAMDITARLANSDTANAEWQWDLYVSYWRMANHSGERAAYYAKGLDLLERLNGEGRLAQSRVGWIETTRQQLNEARAQAAQ